MNEPKYSEVRWPPLRNAIVSLMENVRPNVMGASMEIDITDARTAIRNLQKDLKLALSLHAFLIYCLSRACMRVPETRTYRWGRHKLMIFEDVNVATPIEKRLAGGLRIPVTYVVRNAQDKSLAEITAELRKATKSVDLDGDRTVQLRRRFSSLPRLVRKWLARRVARSPLLLNKFYGNTGFTSVARVGNAFPLFPRISTLHTVSVGIGSQCERLRLVEGGQIERRQVLCVTVAADHDVLDGMPAAKFCNVLESLARSIHQVSVHQ
jgi:pyruvate/2-oxoglutarate dehydrogenase complex dihydrolipoamide acyltransferase (E2) component